MNHLLFSSEYHIYIYYLSKNTGKQIFSPAGILSIAWQFHPMDNDHCYSFWPPRFRSSFSIRSHTRYRNHFLCDASFHYTPDNSLVPLLSPFPFPILLFPLAWQFTSIFPTIGHFPSIPLYLSVIGMIQILIEGDTCRKCLVCRHSWHACAKPWSWHRALCISLCFQGREGCQHQACKDEIYLILLDATSSAVSMQTINLAIMTQRYAHAAWTQIYCCEQKINTHTRRNARTFRRPRTKTYAATCRSTDTRTSSRNTLWHFHLALEACSVMVAWNSLPPAEIKRITPALMSHQQGIRREQKLIEFSVEVESF